MTFLNQKLDFILQLGALLRGVSNGFVVGAVLVLVSVRPMSNRIGAPCEKFVGYDIQDLFLVERQKSAVVVILVELLLLGGFWSGGRLFPLLGLVWATRFLLFFIRLVEL